MEVTFAELAADLAPVYHRRDLRVNGLLYLRGLLMPQVAGNCWSIAEAVGLDRPYRLHHLLDRACCDEDAARDAVRAFLTRLIAAIERSAHIDVSFNVHDSPSDAEERGVGIDTWRPLAATPQPHEIEQESSSVAMAICGVALAISGLLPSAPKAT